MRLEPGLTGTATLVVSDGDTAVALRSGDVPVLATPRLVALAEEATVGAVDGHLEPGQTSVGTSIQLDHLAPSGVGAAVVAEARLASVRGPRLVFTVSVSDKKGLVAVGKITRALVDRDEFLARVPGVRRGSPSGGRRRRGR